MTLSFVFTVGAILALALPALGGEKSFIEKKTDVDSASMQRKRAYEPIAAVILTAMGDKHKLAFCKPEKQGTDRDLYDLEQWLQKALVANTIEVQSPEEVLKCAGVEFTTSSEGIGQVAKRCDAPAALYIMWKEQEGKTQVNLLMAGPTGETLVDLALDIDQPPAEIAHIAEPKHSYSEQTDSAKTSTDTTTGQALDKVIDVQLDSSDKKTPTTASPEKIFLQRKLSILTNESGLQNQGAQKVVQDGTLIGELDLTRLGSRPDLFEQLQKEISHLKTLRTTAVILTIGGFMAVGLSFPMLRGEGDTRLAGGISAGIGAIAGVTGGVLWWLWGDEATRAGGPNPVHHFLTPEQTRKLVQSYNSSLRKELDLDSGQDTNHVSWYVNPGLGGQFNAGVCFAF